jgi:hypothetical protein
MSIVVTTQWLVDVFGARQLWANKIRSPLLYGPGSDNSGERGESSKDEAHFGADEEC